ncbi:hypothetical protein OIU84_000311 [Salix udensis]|uniref:Uncharacterized protein n=1 Tax=Salix udensis TaxID=889485 RepID=A0AAD6L4J3_9ROSI|nr:hypothetical protein OIU84_000311 [Salix udensis]
MAASLAQQESAERGTRTTRTDIGNHNGYDNDTVKSPAPAPSASNTDLPVKAASPVENLERIPAAFMFTDVFLLHLGILWNRSAKG